MAAALETPFGTIVSTNLTPDTGLRATLRVPDSVEVHLVPRSGAPYLGSGECGQGLMAAALANAVADATGRRFRDLSLTPARIRAGLAPVLNENRPA